MTDQAIELNGSSASAPAHTAIPIATSRIAAVTHLLSASRQERAWDVVLATVFDVLEPGPEPAHELLTKEPARYDERSQPAGVCVFQCHRECRVVDVATRPL